MILSWNQERISFFSDSLAALIGKMRLTDIDEFVKLAGGAYTLVDARKADSFADGFLKNSISISADGNFIARFQDLIESDQQVLIVADKEDVAEMMKKIKAAGILQVQGILKGGLDIAEVPAKQKDMLIAIDTEELGIDYRFDEFFLIGRRRLARRPSRPCARRPARGSW
jgi:hypothetical protein